MKVQVCVFAVSLMVASAALVRIPLTHEKPKDLSDIKFIQEEPCSGEGGMCGLASACPPEFRHPQEGLCPAQQDLGVECCYAVPDNIDSCSGRGGECVSPTRCHRAPRDVKGKCPLGKECCIFLV